MDYKEALKKDFSIKLNESFFDNVEPDAHYKYMDQQEQVNKELRYAARLLSQAKSDIPKALAIMKKVAKLSDESENKLNTGLSEIQRLYEKLNAVINSQTNVLKKHGRLKNIA